MSAMTEYAKNVFNDKALLRDKLKIFLHTTDTAKIESYAQACEKFFASGGKQQLGFSATWSWPACIATGFFFLYRKDYLSTVIAFIVMPPRKRAGLDSLWNLREVFHCQKICVSPE